MPTPTIPDALEEAKALVAKWHNHPADRSKWDTADVIYDDCADALEALLPRLAPQPISDEHARALAERIRVAIAEKLKQSTHSVDSLIVTDAVMGIVYPLLSLEAARQPVGLTREQVREARRLSGGVVSEMTDRLNAALHASAPASAYPECLGNELPKLPIEASNGRRTRRGRNRTARIGRTDEVQAGSRPEGAAMKDSRFTDQKCYEKAVKRGDVTFTLVGQDLSGPRCVAFWILENIDTAPASKLNAALERALQMRTMKNRKRAD